jgi:ribosomal protein S18 acetylase RimI-like enzyme
LQLLARVDSEADTWPTMPVVEDADPAIIREARPEDHGALCALLVASFQEFQTWLSREEMFALVASMVDVQARAETGQILVAVREGGVVGTVTYHPDDRNQPIAWPERWAGIRALAVAPSARRHGLGRRLIEACIERARADEARALCLHSADVMEAALSLYRGLGFQRAPALDFRPYRDGRRPAQAGVVAQAYWLSLA